MKAYQYVVVCLSTKNGTLISVYGQFDTLSHAYDYAERLNKYRVGDDGEYNIIYEIRKMRKV